MSLNYESAPEPHTLNPQPSTLNLKPQIMHLKLETLKPRKKLHTQQTTKPEPDNRSGVRMLGICGRCHQLGAGECLGVGVSGCGFRVSGENTS